MGSCWLEAGSKKGAVLKDLSQDEDTGQSIYWAGHFLAHCLWDTGANTFKFRATPYGSYGPTGQQTYQVKLTNASNGTWTYYVNGTQALTLTGARCRNNFNGTVFYVTQSDALFTGIENKDDSNSFTNSTRIDHWQWLNISTGSWKLVDNRIGNVTNCSNPTANNLDYAAAFSIPTDSLGNIISNKIVFTHP